MSNVHISFARGYYIGQVRHRGHIHWETVTGRCRSAKSAMARAVMKMDGHTRVRALFVDTSGWHEPHVAMAGACR